jgi:hypothetical protein
MIALVMMVFQLWVGMCWISGDNFKEVVYWIGALKQKRDSTITLETYSARDNRYWDVHRAWWSTQRRIFVGQFLEGGASPDWG